jgi:hypothetical protein
VLGFIGALSAWFWIYKLRKLRRLETEGHLLEGQVTHCSGVTHKSNYEVKLSYCFYTPDERPLRDKTSRIRHDLYLTALPQPGTPVAVLYLDDTNFRVL